MGMITRREFTGSAAVALAQPASDRLRVGVIGCGIRGVGAHIATLLKMKETDNVEVNAVCDVYDKRAQQAAKLTGGRPYQNYREMLANKDVDVVIIATPDHLHAQMAIKCRLSEGEAPRHGGGWPVPPQLEMERAFCR